MKHWYSKILLTAVVLFAGGDAIMAQTATCDGGPSQGVECVSDLDCNVCQGSGGPCTFPGLNVLLCPATGQTCSGGSQNGISCDGDGGVICFLGGGVCEGGTLGVCETTHSCTAASLPVELSSFIATVNGAAVDLTWSTESEVNNAGFAIEAATQNGSVPSVFEEIAFVDGHGTTEEPQTYRFRVADAGVGIQQFRLKQVDFDGAFEYSDVVEAVVEVPGEFVLEAAYPNPFNPQTTVRFAVSTQQQVSATLVDASGRVVRELYNGSPAANDMQTLRIDGSGLASGTYQVVVRGERFSASEQVVLLK